MDNFRKQTPRKSMHAVDGFLGARPASPNAVRLNRAAQLQQNRLDNFQGRSGFRPNAQPQLRTSGTATVALRQSPRPLDSNVKLELPKSSAERGRKHRSRGKLAIKVVAVLLFLSVLTGGYLFGKGYLKARNIFRGGGSAPALAANVDPTKLKGEGDGRVNVLLLGKGGPGHDGPDLTDTIVVASIDPVQKTASLLSIPRDLWVKTDRGSSKINAVYANAKYAVLAGKKTSDIQQRAQDAGVAAIQAEVQQTMGIPIHYYVMVDFQAFEQAINTVGGVDINVDPNSTSDIVRETLWDEMTKKNYTLDVQPGMNHFDGQRALMYARSRHTSARGDFDRSERQRKIMVALKDKILSAGTYGNPVKISQLIDAFGDHVQSDLSTNDLMRLYDISKTIDSSKISSLGLADEPHVLVTTDNIDGQSIVRPKAGLTDFSAIQSFVRNALRDSYLQKENANIAVYNGTKITGLASTKADELKSYGYGITTVANAPTQTYSSTVLVDLTHGAKKYTQHYLEQRLKTTAVTTMPDNTINPGNADFVIILGSDESTSQ